MMAPAWRRDHVYPHAANRFESNTMGLCARKLGIIGGFVDIEGMFDMLLPSLQHTTRP
jgi:hypothetical protein